MKQDRERPQPYGDERGCVRLWLFVTLVRHGEEGAEGAQGGLGHARQVVPLLGARDTEMTRERQGAAVPPRPSAAPASTHTLTAKAQGDAAQGEGMGGRASQACTLPCWRSTASRALAAPCANAVFLQQIDSITGAVRRGQAGAGHLAPRTHAETRLGVGPASALPVPYLLPAEEITI